MAEPLPAEGGADVDTELRALRMRAFGPDPDIEDDPIALARLAELEAARPTAHASLPPSEAAPAAPAGPAHASTPVLTEPTLVHTSWGLLALLAAALVVVLGVAVSALVSGARPDATLHPSGDDPDDQLIALLESEGAEFRLDRSALRGASEMEIDLSTLRGFGTYRDIEVWSAVNVFDSPCLIAVHRPTVDVAERACVPSGAELFIDTRGHGLSGGERLRFTLRGDTILVHLLTPEELS